MDRWDERVRGLVDDSSPQTALRVVRGRAYARSGRVTDLRAGTGVLAARVQGTRSTPYGVEVTAPPLDDDAWRLVVGAIAGQVRHGARLLAGQVPDGLEDELTAIGVALFPRRSAVSGDCGCDDPLRPCAHVAAVLEHAADEIAGDPFLLLRWRGRGRERLLAELADARRGEADDGTAPLRLLNGRDWVRPAAAVPDDLESLDAEPSLERLGDPPEWAGGVSARDLFHPLVEGAAAWAAHAGSRADSRADSWADSGADSGADSWADSRAGD